MVGVAPGGVDAVVAAVARWRLLGWHRSPRASPRNARHGTQHDKKAVMEGARVEIALRRPGHASLEKITAMLH